MKIDVEKVKKAIVNFDERYLNQEIEDFQMLDLPIGIMEILYNGEKVSEAILEHTNQQLYVVTTIIEQVEVPQLLIEYAKGITLNHGIHKVMKPNNLVFFWESLLKLNDIEGLTDKNLRLLRMINLDRNILWLRTQKENYFIILKIHSDDLEINISEGFKGLNRKLKELSVIIGIIN